MGFYPCKNRLFFCQTFFGAAKAWAMPVSKKNLLHARSLPFRFQSCAVQDFFALRQDL
jgi:hypothetical protein